MRAVLSRSGMTRRVDSLDGPFFLTGYIVGAHRVLPRTVAGRTPRLTDSVATVFSRCRLQRPRHRTPFRARSSAQTELEGGPLPRLAKVTAEAAGRADQRSACRPPFSSASEPPRARNPWRSHRQLRRARRNRRAVWANRRTSPGRRSPLRAPFVGRGGAIVRGR